MNDHHCHQCGQEQSIDEAAQVAVQVAALEDEPCDQTLMTLRDKARSFLDDYLTTRHNRLVAQRMPQL